MRVRLIPFASLLLLGACGGGGGDFVDGGADTPEVTSAEPDHGSLLGGTKIVLTGHGFLYNNASANHVIVGTREAPAATVIDDQHLEVVLPAGEAPGDADILVFNSNGYASASGLFRYSEQPTITSISPVETLYNVESTVTVTGSGFLDDSAGVNTLLIDGVVAIDLEITSDTELTFTALPGQPLAKPDLQLVNRRGEAEEPDAFQYIVSLNPGLLMFSKDAGSYAFFYDITTMTLTTIPHRIAFGGGGGGGERYRSAILMPDGTYYGQRRPPGSCCPSGNLWEQFDPGEQRVLSSLTQDYALADMARVGATVFATTTPNTSNGSSFGRVDLATGAFTNIGPPSTLGCCGGYALVSDGTTVYFYNEPQIGAINTTTGARTGLVTLTPAVARVDSLQFVGGTLYGFNQITGTLVSINPTTGATAIVAALGVQISAMVGLE